MAFVCVVAFYLIVPLAMSGVLVVCDSVARKLDGFDI